MKKQLKNRKQDLETLDHDSSVLPSDGKIERGQWYWVKDEEDDSKQLACVVHIGSNYIELETPHDSRYWTDWRIHFDNFEKRTIRELDAEQIIKDKVAYHQKRVMALLGKIKLLSQNLGLIPKGLSSGESEPSTALVVAHNTPDIKAHKKALIKAKDKTLPELFKKVEEEHAQVARWMKAPLAPMRAESEVLKKQTETIEDRIFTVELYAGLCEELTKIREGKPAGNDEQVCLFQRRHYMDEECLVDYTAGGMNFKKIEEFDQWLLKKNNRERVLPFPKCIVAFRIRRHDKDYGTPTSLAQIISFSNMSKWDKKTFLYIRNGESYYRLQTDIDFGENLFPKDGVPLLSSGNLYIKARSSQISVIAEDEYKELKAEEDKEEAEYKRDMKAWKKLSEKQKEKKGFEPYRNHRWDKYELLDHDTVYYDDAMEYLASIAKDHNRIAIVLQGILDRSESLHPHPPWQLWTEEGFKTGIKLIFDNQGLVSGKRPDFEAYRARLNKSITKGTHTIGQEDLWERREARKENDRRSRGYRDPGYTLEHYQPYGNPGPGFIANVWYTSRDKSKCNYQWERERQGYSWRASGEGPITTRFSCYSKSLMNVDAYVPGDYHKFYDDHRTRQDYLEWAPLLLKAEDFHAAKAKKRKGKKRGK